MQHITRSIESTKQALRSLKQDLRRHEQAREVIRIVSIKTQEQLQNHISDIASLALNAVFDEPYELIAEFVQRRNKTECDLLFIQKNERVDPITASGGGAVDIASFALRIASYTMQYKPSNNTIILDEPFRFLSEDLQERASVMIKELSEKLNIQFIIVTHEQTLTEYADKKFHNTKRKGVSTIYEEE
jgi:DNA repair exonuclease SbcCD ATPase subunit